MRKIWKNHPSALLIPTRTLDNSSRARQRFITGSSKINHGLVVALASGLTVRGQVDGPRRRRIRSHRRTALWATHDGNTWLISALMISVHRIRLCKVSWSGCGHGSGHGRHSRSGLIAGSSHHVRHHIHKHSKTLVMHNRDKNTAKDNHCEFRLRTECRATPVLALHSSERTIETIHILAQVIRKAIQ